MAEPLKNIFFQRDMFEKLSSEVKKIYPKFDKTKFFKLLYDNGWESLNLLQRMNHAAKVLSEMLPRDYKQSINILIKVEKFINGFDHLLFAEFVRVYGLEDFDTSMDTLEIFTRSSAEFAVRPFIKKYPKKAMKRMLSWSKSSNEHVRRLASEGSRPRLPWAEGLPDFKKDPNEIIPILENLKNDPSEYVRRSVANNLNDISKDHPSLVLNIAKKWIGKTENTDKLLKHALRTLLKKGNKVALGLFGLKDDKDLLIKEPSIDPQNIKIGDNASLSFSIENNSKVSKKVRIEYKIYFKRKDGKFSEKVFQVKEFFYKSGSKEIIKRKLNFADKTTRKHYSGEHKIVIIVNGIEKEFLNFNLES